MTQELYRLPDYTSPLTEDFDEYLAVWRNMAAPIEKKMGLVLSGFDPDFQFTKNDSNSDMSVAISLPIWFVRELSDLLSPKEKS